MTALTTAAFADIVSFTRASSGTYWGEDGLLATAATSGAIPAGLNRLDIGSDHAGINRLNGHIRRIPFRPRRWADAQLQDFSA